ncbi:phasin family protein [Rhodoferax sp. UBA5149]|uniref:phasin family protein n=1 Tax=Rhodoferax sp. UBA5149 TaxID=1947379 RepID=UPI0025CFF77E|nr:phasin family protein [Rhodoferax sp. UBA5149]
MNNTAEQLIATNKANLQALQALTTQAFAGIEKLVELNLAASRATLGDSFSHAQAVLGAKDAQELLALQSAVFKPFAEKSAAYVQHVQTIVTGSSAEFTKAVEAKTAEAQKAFSGVVENLAKNAPAGSETALAAFKSALTAGQNAVESAQTSAKKAVETAQSNFTAVATQTVDAVKKATKVA